MDFKIDMCEMEKQRYDRIKKSGSYMELDILISGETEKFDGHTGKMPVVTTCMHGCGPEEVANMYVVLKNMMEYYEKEYPVECALANLTMKCNHMGSVDQPLNNDKEE